MILISIDTLRADHVGVRNLTPSIDAFAKTAMRFTSAWSHTPLTLPAHASILTGLLPTNHGVRDNVGFELRAGSTLAERFKKAGYVTGGFVSSTVLRRETGIARGFDTFDDQMPGAGLERPGSATVALALRFAAAHRAAPFFLFVHLYDPHTPYAAPQAFAARGESDYDREIAAADAAVGVLLDGLRAIGLGRAAIAVTADHGEGLGDHGEAEHGLLLYAEALRVPLLIARPDGGGAGSAIAATVRHVDIAPTLLSLAGLDSGGTDGAPLVPNLTGGSRVAYSETWYPRLHFGWSELASAAEGRWHYIAGPKPELYDLEADPGEASNLNADPARPGAAMARYLTALQGSAKPSTSQPISDETEERLRSLGYLGATRASKNSGGANPRDKLRFYQPFMTAFTQAHAARALGDLPKAVEHYRRAIDLLRLEEGLVVPKLQFGLGDSLARLGRTDPALKAFRAELAIDPTNIETRTALGSLYWSVGQDDSAREAITGIVTANPKAGEREYAAVIHAFEVLGDTTGAAAWHLQVRKLRRQ
ncbi:MAG: sulfatase-like hydrolase/transferase [Vicinamibacteria bacterium]